MLNMNFIKVWYDWMPTTEIYELCDFNLDLYHENIKAAIMKMKVSGDIQQCVRITLKGTEYVKGHAIMIRQDGYEENITIGKISLFLCSIDLHVYILFEVVESYFRPYLRAYQLGPKIGYECLLLHDIMDFKPMHIYDLGNMLIIKPLAMDLWLITSNMYHILLHSVMFKQIIKYIFSNIQIFMSKFISLVILLFTKVIHMYIIDNFHFNNEFRINYINHYYIVWLYGYYFSDIICHFHNICFNLH